MLTQQLRACQCRDFTPLPTFLPFFLRFLLDSHQKRPSLSKGSANPRAFRASPADSERRCLATFTGSYVISNGRLWGTKKCLPYPMTYIPKACPSRAAHGVATLRPAASLRGAPGRSPRRFGRHHRAHVAWTFSSVRRTRFDRDARCRSFLPRFRASDGTPSRSAGARRSSRPRERRRLHVVEGLEVSSRRSVCSLSVSFLDLVAEVVASLHCALSGPCAWPPDCDSPQLGQDHLVAEATLDRLVFASASPLPHVSPRYGGLWGPASARPPPTHSVRSQNH